MTIAHAQDPSHILLSRSIWPGLNCYLHVAISDVALRETSSNEVECSIERFIQRDTFILRRTLSIYKIRDLTWETFCAIDFVRQVLSLLVHLHFNL